MTNEVRLNRSDAKKLHGGCDEENATSTKPRRGSILYKMVLLKRVGLILVAGLPFVKMVAAEPSGSRDWIARQIASRPNFPRSYLRSPEKFTLGERNGESFTVEAELASKHLASDVPLVWDVKVSSDVERLVVGTCSPLKDIHWEFGVYTQLGNPTPYYWHGEGYPVCSEGDVFLAAVRRARELFCAGSGEVRVSYLPEVIGRETFRVTGVRGKVIDLPFDQTVFVFINDKPDANWCHPCRYVFFSADLSEFVVSYQMDLPRFMRQGSNEEVYLKGDGQKKSDVLSLERVQNAVYSASKAMKSDSNAISYSGDTSHSYFVLLSGGQCPAKNGIRFWADTAMFYSTLRNKYGIPKDQIWVYMSDGISTGADANLASTDDGSPVLVSSPLDLDGDGDGDIDGAATKANFQTVLASTLTSKLNSEDQLYVFITSHGGPDGVGGYLNHDCVACLFNSTGDAVFTDDELSTWTENLKCPVVFAIETCYSGGFIDDIAATPKRVIATACNHYENSSGTHSGGVWGDGATGKTSAFNGWAMPMTAAFRGYWPASLSFSGSTLSSLVAAYPWSTGVECSADSNADGYVSFREASDFAKRNDPFRCSGSSHPIGCTGGEHPQFSESTSGLGASFFIVKNFEPKLDFGASSKTVDAEGGSVSVAVSANVSWTVSKSAGAAWLNLSSASGTGNGSVNFTVDRNNTTSARNATLTLAGEGMTKTCSVLQEGMTAPVRPVVTASDGSSSDSITVKWEKCARALTYSLKRAESATGDKIILDANAVSPYVDVNVIPGKTYYYWVTAVNEIGSNESSYDSGYRSISLNLDAGGNVYTKNGGEASFSVSGNSSWTVTCADEWITLGTTSGSGSGVVSFTLDKNFEGDARYGTIVVTSGSVSRTITVTQPGRVLVVANSGSITINTGVSSPSFYVSSSGKTYYGSVVDGTAVYKFDYLEIGSAVSVSVSGSRPLVIESETDMKVACGFDVSGTSTGRCGGGIGGAGGSGGTTVTGGSGGSGGSRGSGGNGYTVSNYSGTTQGQSGKSGSAGDTGYNGSSGNYGTSGSSGGKGFGSTGSAASGGSRGSGGSAGSAASSVGSLGTGGYAGADGNPGGSGTKGNAGGAGNDGSSGSNGVNAFTSALTSDVIVAGAGGGGGGGGGSGGSGGGGSGGGGGGGGGGTSQSEATSYSGNSVYINRGVYQGAIGGFGGTGGSGGKGATSGAGGSGGTGGHGGGAIVLKAAGVMKFTGSVDVSAANGSRSGSSGSSASSASSGVSGGSGTAGQGALNLQTFSSLYPSSGHKGGNGGTGGAGGNAGKGGAGGAGGYGAPGMVKLYASVLLASDGRVSGANGDNSTTASRCGGLTLATNMKSAALTAQKPTVATTIKCGERSGSPSLKITSVYDEEVTVPVVGQLKVSHADASGVCESGNYALSLVSSQSAAGSVDGLTIKRLTTLFEGYDQIFLINDSSAKIGPVEVAINGVACSIPELAVGEAWTTCVQAGVAVAGGEVPPAEPTAVTASDGTYSDKVLVSWTGSSGATSYNLYRSTTSTRPSAATKTGVTSPYSDTSATPGVTYYYWVSAVNSAGSSCSSYNTGYRAVSVSIGATTASFDAAGGAGSTVVTANTSWSATTDVSWITLTTSSGSGNGTVAYTVAASTSVEPRTGTITITVGAGTSHSVTKTITVSQSAVEDDGKMPDLAFAQFSDWNHGFAIFTVAQDGDSTNTPLRVFDKGEGFSLVYGYANFGEGVAVGAMTNRIELFDVDGELVYENDGDETIDFEQYWGRSQVFTAYSWGGLEPGAYIAQVSLDAYDQIVEEDEDNNVETFQFAVRDPVSLNEALDNTTLTFETDVARGWFGTKGFGADGVDVAQCTHIGHSSTNSMSATVTGPGTIAFKWKVSSEAGYDELCFLVDGMMRSSRSGTGGDWDERSYELSSGTHTLTWAYCKDDSYSDGVDCGWVDQVSWTPTQTTPTAPTGVSATDGAYSDKVSISWMGSSGVTSYNLYRSTTSTRPSTAMMTGVTSPYSDTAATPGITYYYWVSAVNSAGSSYSTPDTGYRAVSLALGKTTDSYEAVGGSGSVSVTANTSWSASKDVNWITFGANSGNGNGIVGYTVAANASSASRSGTITVTAGSGTSHPVTKTIAVMQEGKSDFVIVDGVLKKYTGAGGAVSVPSGVTSIGTGAFEYCGEVTSVILPMGVASIDFEAFRGCTNLSSITMPTSMTNIESFAFYACPALTSVEIPEAVMNIGFNAFLSCESLMEIHVSANNADYSSIDGILYDKIGSVLLQCPAGKVGAVEIPSGVERIGEWSFYSCGGITSVTIPSSVMDIGEVAFAFCRMPAVAIPLGVASIGESAFYYSDLVSVTIPTSVTSIGAEAFLGCHKLATVYVSPGDAERIVALYEFDSDVRFVELVSDHTVTFDANGGECTVPSKVVKDGEAVGELPGATLAGHTFDGWYTAKEGGERVSADTIVSSDVTWFAHWSESASPDPKPDWKEQIVVMPYKQSVFVRIYDVTTKSYLEHAEGMLVAFAANGECRGCTTLLSGPVCKLFQLSVGIESESEKGFTLKYWNPTTGILDVREGFDANENKKIGSIVTPETYHVGEIEFELSMKSGWNWISIPIKPADLSIESVMNGFTFVDEDSVMSADGTATYYGGQWYSGDFDTITPGAGYCVHKGSSGVQAVIVSGEAIANSSSVQSGWNWIGCPVVQQVGLSDITHSAGFVDEDEINSADGLAVCYSGLWYSSDFDVLNPGAAYVAKLARAGTLTFGGGGKAMSASDFMSLKSCNAMSVGKGLAPSWKDEIVIQPESLSLFCKVTKGPDGELIEADGSMLGVFAANGECRGATTILTVPNLGKFFQLKVGAENAQESGFKLKVWDAATGKVLEIEGSFGFADCTGDKKIGSFTSPVTKIAIVSLPIPPLPPNPTAEDVRKALEGSADGHLQERITEPTEYNAYRAWAESVKASGGSAAAGAQAVKDSPHAWLSYVLDSAILIQAEPVEGDLRVEEFKPTATAGLFDFTVSVEDISVGEGAKPGNLAQVFGIEGGSTLLAQDMSSDKVDITFGTPENGKVKFTAGPKDKTEPTFFMKVEMKP